MHAQFKTTLFTINDWTILHLPKEVSTEFSSRAQIMVQGTINEVPFRAVLEPDGNWSHWFRVDDELQKQIKATSGDEVRVTVEQTDDWLEPEVPQDFQTALEGDEKAYKLWQSISAVAHWDWIRWIGSTKDPKTRERRIAVSLSKLDSGMKRPCCFNRSMCCVPDVSKNGVLLSS